MARPVCIRYITKESFLLRHSLIDDFLLSRWHDSALVYAVWSSICCVYCLSMIVYSALFSEHGTKILIWLTYWAFYCLFIRFTLTAFNCWYHIFCCPAERLTGVPRQCTYSEDAESACMQCCIHQLDPSEQELQAIRQKSQDSTYPLFEKKFPKTISVQWLFQNITNVSSIMVTVMFWTMVYTGNSQTYVSINSHVMNSVLVISDIMISRAPCRLQHVYIPLLYNLVYILFTVIYWLAGGTDGHGRHFIYRTLDYSQTPAKACVAILLVCLIALPLAHALVYGLFQLRQLIHRCCNDNVQTGLKVVYSKDDKAKETYNIIYFISG